MTAPRVRVERELPAVSWTDWSSVNLVRSALDQLERGVFDSAAQVVDGMTRDDRISGVLTARCGALPGLPFKMNPLGKGTREREIAEECEKSFEKMFPDSALFELLQWGILLGLGVGELVWQFTETRWTPTLKVWHPRFVWWDEQNQVLRLNTMNGERILTPGDGQWVVFTPYGLKRGWMGGKVRPLATPWLMRQWGMRDWARASEVWGTPIRLARTPANGSEEDKQDFTAAVLDIAAETAVRLPQTAEPGNNYNLELLEAQTDFSAAFERLLDKAEICIAIALLGQNLTTEVQGGAYAAAQIHAMIRNDILRSDAESLGKCIREQALSWWAQHNFGNKELAPAPCWKTEPPEDKKAKGEAMSAAGKGIQDLQAAGAKPDTDKILEDLGIPVTADAEEPPSLEEQMKAEEEAATKPPEGE